MDKLREADHFIGIQKAYYTLLYNNVKIPFGRCKFEKIMVEKGYKLDSVISYQPAKTKASNRYFDNSVADLEVNDINQVWLSDSTYWHLPQGWVYATTLMDVCSRRLLALIPSDGMTAEETVIPALLEAVAHRQGKGLSSCIFHSDRGGQYLDKVFLRHLGDLGIRSSMAENVYENPHIERVNLTLKRLLIQQKVKTFEDFVSSCGLIQEYYNERRLHNGLLPYRETPCGYESLILGLEQHQRPILTLPPKST
jgi:transposase InsO family protein